MTQDPKVSVITPVFNSETYLAEAVESVGNQSYQDWEHIIIDDGSTDTSKDIIEEYRKCDGRIRPIYLQKNSGPAIARNCGIEAARGRFISFIDADDIWLPDKLTAQIGFMENQGHAFTFTAYRKINEGGQIIGRAINTPDEVSYSDLLRSCVIGCLTAAYDAKALGKQYMPDIRRAQDYGLWLKILKKIPYAYGLNQCHALYRIRSNSVSANKLRKASYQWRVYRELEELSLLSSARLFVEYAIRGFGKWTR